MISLLKKLFSKNGAAPALPPVVQVQPIASSATSSSTSTRISTVTFGLSGFSGYSGFMPRGRPMISLFPNMGPMHLFSFLSGITNVVDSNGMLICDDWQTIFTYADPSIIEMPTLKHPGYRMVDVSQQTMNGVAITIKDFVKMMNTVLVYCRDTEFGIPQRKYDSVGFDLHCLKDAVVEPGEFMDVETGVHCAFPSHIWGLLVSRSSIFKKRLIVNTGIIDPGFQGELFACVYNAGKEPFKIERGNRLAQLIPMQDVPMVGVQKADSLDDFPATRRGTSGFGSTGT